MGRRRSSRPPLIQPVKGFYPSLRPLGPILNDWAFEGALLAPFMRLNYRPGAQTFVRGRVGVRPLVDKLHIPRSWSKVKPATPEGLYHGRPIRIRFYAIGDVADQLLKLYVGDHIRLWGGYAPDHRAYDAYRNATRFELVARIKDPSPLPADPFAYPAEGTPAAEPVDLSDTDEVLAAVLGPPKMRRRRFVLPSTEPPDTEPAGEPARTGEDAEEDDDAHPGR